METNTSYRYEALNDKSYQKLAEFTAHAAVATTTLYPKHKTVVISATDAELDFIGRTGRFIDDNGLDFHISPIEIEDDNLINLVNTEAIDTETLRRVTCRIIEQSRIAAEKKDKIISEMAASNEAVKSDLNHYRELYLKYADTNCRIYEQIRAIGTLVDSIFPKK